MVQNEVTLCLCFVIIHFVVTSEITHMRTRGPLPGEEETAHCDLFCQGGVYIWTNIGCQGGDGVSGLYIDDPLE